MKTAFLPFFPTLSHLNPAGRTEGHRNMARLRTAMDAGFWDLNISTTQSLDGIARSIPGEPIPLDAARSTRVLRMQQLSFLKQGFPLGIFPIWSPTPQKELGSFALHSLLFKTVSPDWWLGIIGQFRPRKLISSIKSECYDGDEWEIPAFKDVARHFLDKSLFSLGLCAQIALTSSSSLLLSTDKRGERKGCRSRAIFSHQLPNHDITLEAAWPQLFMDKDGKYWEIPESISIDCLSLVSESGLRYRFGIHRNGGLPQSVDPSISAEPPLALKPGFCAKAALSYEKSQDIWRQEEKEVDAVIETPGGKYFLPAYDIFLKEPHSAISGIIGATCTSWFGGKSTTAGESEEVRDNATHLASHRSPLSLDGFGSFCYTFQHGKFTNLLGDLTRLDARLDVTSFMALARQVSNVVRKNSNPSAGSSASFPRLNLTVRQQVWGPIVFRLDSQYSLDSSSTGHRGPHLEDVIYSLNYSLRLLQSGKVVAWYSPKRKEGMIELRMFEF